jgi:hypothetical protein
MFIHLNLDLKRNETSETRILHVFPFSETDKRNIFVKTLAVSVLPPLTAQIYLLRSFALSLRA